MAADDFETVELTAETVRQLLLRTGPWELPGMTIHSLLDFADQSSKLFGKLDEACAPLCSPDPNAKSYDRPHGELARLPGGWSHGAAISMLKTDLERLHSRYRATDQCYSGTVKRLLAITHVITQLDLST